jgi:hypothetical protein
MLIRTTEYIIYESPDGGETIYKRDSGSALRELVRAKETVIISFSEWNEICRLSQTNVAIKESLEQLKLIYELSKENN